jgi:hypothetical protein
MPINRRSDGLRLVGSKTAAEVRADFLEFFQTNYESAIWFVRGKTPGHTWPEVQIMLQQAL